MINPKDSLGIPNFGPWYFEVLPNQNKEVEIAKTIEFIGSVIDDKLINIERSEKYGIKGYLFNENEDINSLYKNMQDNGINI